MPRIDLASAPTRDGTGYPPPYDEPCRARRRVKLGDAAGLTQFGVNLLHLEPGTWSSQRHWHTAEDEFVYVLEGEVALVDDAGETLLRAGDCAGFKAGDPNGHHLINRSWGNALFLAVGPNNPADRATYPDIDLMYDGSTNSYTRKDGTPYPKRDANAAPAVQPPLEEHTLNPRVYRHD